MAMELNLREHVSEQALNRPEGMSVCFTGHRPKDLHGYEKAPYYKIVDEIQAVCEELTNHGVRTFISGGAQGVDQLAFWAVNRICRAGKNVQNKVFVPFPQQPDRWKRTGLFSQDEYHKMLRSATKVDVLADNPANTSEAVKLLHTRNHVMVNHSDVVVAFMAGQILETGWRDSKGGTAECIRYAVKNHVPVLAIQYRPTEPNPFTLVWIE